MLKQINCARCNGLIWREVKVNRKRVCNPCQKKLEKERSKRYRRKNKRRWDAKYGKKIRMAEKFNLENMTPEQLLEYVGWRNRHGKKIKT